MFWDPPPRGRKNQPPLEKIWDPPPPRPPDPWACMAERVLYSVACLLCWLAAGWLGFGEKCTFRVPPHYIKAASPFPSSWIKIGGGRAGLWERGGGRLFRCCIRRARDREREREREREVNDLLTWGPNPTDRPSNR